MKPATSKPRSVDSPAPAEPRAAAPLAQGLREFARAARHIHDLNTFLEIFRVGLEKTGLCSQVDFRMPPPDADGSEPGVFAPGRLSLPVTAAGEVVTVASVSPPSEKQHFGPEDLQVLASLSELVGSAIGLAHRLQSGDRAVATLKSILSFAPVGLCVFEADGRVEAINTLARGWLALAEGDAIQSALPAGTSLEAVRDGLSFHLRVSGRLLFCETRPQPETGHVALVVTDLTPEQGRLLDALTREVYRANHLGRSLQFVLLERSQPMGALLATLPALRLALGRAAIVGPYDAARIALIFPEATWSATVLQLRRIATMIGGPDVRLGRAELTTHAETPETLIAAALAMSETFTQAVRPRILVHDEYRGVGDALRLVLGGNCDVTGSTDVAEASRLVQEQHFDAVLADLGLADGAHDIVAAARARNQHVRAFYLSSTLPLGLSGQAGPRGGVPVFSKPFNVELVRDRILASLGTPAVETHE